MLFVNPNARLYQNMPPLALAYLATKLKVKVIDQNTMPEPPDRFLNHKVNILGIFVRSVSFTESQRIAEIYKEKYPEAKIKSIYSPVDVQCCYPTIQFEEKIEDSQLFGDSYPFPDFELFDSFEIFQKNWQKGTWLYPIMTSSGCPFQCIYCAARNRHWYPRSAKNCVEELEQAKKRFRIVSFEVLDDAFNVDKVRVLKFCKLVTPLKLRWICANGLRADRLDEEMAQAMAKAGCTDVSFGIESVDTKVLENVQKGETVEQIERGIDIAKKYFKNVNGFFIIGLPGSSYKKDLESVEWMIKKRITGVFSYYVPFDKQLEYDDMFYGAEAKPQSDEYPKNKQETIYQMTAFMRQETNLKSLLPKTLSLLALIYRFDRNNFFRTSFSYFKRLF